MVSIKEKGFTLIELVLIIGLLVLTAGVSSDIIITLIRSYNKTQITNEIEQSADFVLLKLEREVRDAESVTVASGTTLTFKNADSHTIIYEVVSGAEGGMIVRRSDTAPPPVGTTTTYELTDSSFLGGGMNIICPGNICFATTVTNGIGVVSVSMDFAQTTRATGKAAFTGTIPVRTTIVVRSMYKGAH
ncbi:MAG: hypothetical protein WC243_01435 [Patescibacteria group bacterium]|jgi:hypothetical protein